MTPLVHACVLLALAAPGRFGTPPDQAREVCKAVEHLAPAQGFSPWTLAAIAWHESRFKPKARNKRTGAAGVFQVLLGRRWSVPYSDEELLDPWLSVEAGMLAAVRWRDYCGDERWIGGYAGGRGCAASGYVATVRRYEERLRFLAEREWRACWKENRHERSQENTKKI